MRLRHKVHNETEKEVSEKNTLEDDTEDDTMEEMMDENETTEDEQWLLRQIPSKRGPSVRPSSCISVESR